MIDIDSKLYKHLFYDKRMLLGKFDDSTVNFTWITGLFDFELMILCWFSETKRKPEILYLQNDGYCLKNFTDIIYVIKECYWASLMTVL